MYSTVVRTSFVVVQSFGMSGLRVQLVAVRNEITALERALAEKLREVILSATCSSFFASLPHVWKGSPY